MTKKNLFDQLIVDGRRVQGTRTGVGHYTMSILKSWPQSHALEVLQSKSKPLEKIPQQNVVALPGGVFWHLSAAIRTFAHRATYFSPESLFVPILVGKRALLTIHDLTPLDNPEKHSRWNVLIHKLAMRSAVRRVGKIIVPTERVSRDMARHFPNHHSKVVVVYEGAQTVIESENLIDSVPSPEIEKPYVLYVGTIEPRKNVIRMIRCALRSLPEDWVIVIAGRIGWLSDQENIDFEKLSRDPRVNYLGFAPDNWLSTLYKNASAFCYVSESEGFGLPVAEAMLHGIPVIHSDDPALTEVAANAGIVVRREFLESDLSDAFRYVSMLTPDQLRRISISSREVASRFDWGVAAQATSGVASLLSVRLRQ